MGWSGKIGEIRGYKASIIVDSFGPQVWSTTTSPKAFLFPFPYPSCVNVKKKKKEILPKEMGAVAGLHSFWASTCPPPEPPMKLHKNSQHCCEIMSSPFLCQCQFNSSVLTYFLLGPKKQQKTSIEHVKI